MDLFATFIFSFLVISVKCWKNEGDPCSSNGQNGTCIAVRRCAFAEELFRNGKRPETCGYTVWEPIICCVRKPYVISRQVCRRYNTSYAYEVGGTFAKPKTYFHMALIGFGEPPDVHWDCGGSLISETFVLTAAHCLKSKQFGEAKYVRLGELDILNTTEDAQPLDILVKKRIPHPEYRSPSQYNDIALIEIEQKNFSIDYIKPACLHLKENLPTTNLVATGWGKLGFAAEPSSHLMELKLNLVSTDECQKSYETVSKRKLSRGIDRQTHICAGGEEGKDTCEGDSGGPLQIRPYGNDRPWSLVAVISFGKACGIGKIPGVYTKIYPYIPWIEDIVWPDQIV